MHDDREHVTEHCVCPTGSGVTVYSLHPGVVQTELWRHLSAPVQVAVRIFSPFTKTSVQGAQTTIYCAVEPALEKESGGYYRLCMCVSVCGWCVCVL